MLFLFVCVLREAISEQLWIPLEINILLMLPMCIPYINYTLVYMLYVSRAFHTEWRQGAEDTESHPAVTCWRTTDHKKAILCVWSITLTDADIISYPAHRCPVAGHHSLPTHFHRVSRNVTPVQRFVKKRHSETCFMHHRILCLPKPLIGRWCNRTYPNPTSLFWWPYERWLISYAYWFGLMPGMTGKTQHSWAGQRLKRDPLAVQHLSSNSAVISS